MGTTYLSLCAGCAQKMDPGLFGKMGRSTYHLREIPGSARTGRCAICNMFYNLSQYELQPVRIRYKQSTGGGERAKAGRGRK